MKKNKLLIIGWDAADWKLIHPLMDQGLMPTLEKLVNGGVIGNLATLNPPLSPMLWTSIATGKTADKHGILGFAEPIPDTGGVRPVNVTSRKTRALWNILHHKGFRTNLVGWWPSHPAEPIQGAVVSNFFHQAADEYGKPWKVPRHSVHPPDLLDYLTQLRVHPGEITGPILQPFVPLIDKIDQEKDKRLASLAKIIADTATHQAVTTWLMQHTEWDVTAVYLDAIDHFGHGFMRYHPPRRPWIDEKDFALYKEVINAGYRFHDMMLERLVNLAGEDCAILLISDHGFHSDHLRPHSLPKVPAAPAYEHSPYGIFLLKGNGIRKDERVFGASLLDIAPTVLHYLGLPIGEDMDGKVLLEAWEAPMAPDYIESWDALPGDFGEHPPHQREDTYASAEALKQLVELGYIEDPGEDKTQGMEKTVRESRYNLSRVWMSKRKYPEAIAELKNLITQCPDDLRFNHDLANALINTGDYSGARECLERIRNSEYHNIPTLDLLEGVIMLNEGRSREALALFEEAESKESRLPELQLQLGKIYLQEHRYDKARRAFTRAIEIDENSAASHLGLGIALLRQGDVEGAVDHLLNCIGLIYHYPVAHYHLGEALFRLEKFEEAAQAFELCLSMAPKTIKARRFLINIYQEFLQDEMKAQAHQEILNQRMKGNITIVSGLPRSGTSMMMQMLEAGGMKIFADGQRTADESNPKGYYEAEAIKRLAVDTSCLADATDKGVKIVAPLLKFLPNDYEYNIVFMDRELEEVLSSQQKMLGKEGVYNPSLMEAFRKELEKVEAWSTAQPHVRMLRIAYAEAVAKPLETAHKVADFLPYPLEAQKMAGIIDPALYRNRS